ncbi:MAG: hypothetical protein PHT46_06775 [Candidatus Marinimicrobia bacterium]|jgi:hypothetical protein|nr:hypothetical protein [Candidatus Neomarinimicrobiota bacterium]MDD5710028.1 hypothetical protein [Candidatus Neomarinimicrobiota bacterium]
MKIFPQRFIPLFLLLITFLIAEGTAPLNRNYLHLDTGAGYGSYHDAGTSPLRYQGAAFASSAGFLCANPEYRWGIRTDLHYTAGLATDHYLLHSLYSAGDVFYLRHVTQLLPGNLNLFTGPALGAAFAFTYNDAYQNASANPDFFVNLFLRSQIQFAFQRPAWDRKIAFLRLQRPLRDYALAFRLDIPFLHLNNRPAFPYVVNGTQTDIEKIFLRHAFVGGIQLQSRLGLTRFLNNGNAIEMAYLWEMISTGNRDIYRLESARHALVFAFYFRLN